MNGRTILAAPAVVLAAAAATTAFAAVTLKDPKTLALQKSDFPAGAVQFPVPDSTVRGALASFYEVTFNFRNGSREEEVTSHVTVSPSSGGAASQYQSYVGLNSGLKGITAVKLPAYGDGQYAAFIQGPKTGGYSRARGVLVVRKDDVVWELTVESCGPWAPAGCVHAVTPPNLTKPQAIAELKKYALKQKARVGSG